MHAEPTRAAQLCEMLGTAAALVIQHGRVIWTWGDVDRPQNVRSVRKSLLNALCGIGAPTERSCALRGAPHFIDCRRSAVQNHNQLCFTAMLNNITSSAPITAPW